ncbi:MAG: iron complex outermembrane receptor protein [Hyphomicrobiaceae bacterium]|jgi:iron complex outermembrane receptor protein
MSTKLVPLLIGMCLLLFVQSEATAQEPGQATSGDLDLDDLSLEELMDVPIEVGSRQTQSLGKTAASVFVLNEPEIRRSGMRSVPELLRLVPGLVIAQDVPGAYGFSSRLGEYGFAGMLVLIDGQRLYTTLLRREYWQAVDLPVEIIERIEVIRGPGGSRWGDKASQGVINIVTKKAGDRTQGLRVTGWLGSEERLGGSFRYGQKLGDQTAMYLYGKKATRDGGFPDVSGDRWDNSSLGGRVDTTLSDGTTWSVDGLYHDSFIGDSYESFMGYSSLNMIKAGHIKSKVHIDHGPNQFTEWRFGANLYDQDIKDDFNATPQQHLRYREDLFDTMLMHSWSPAPSHQFTVGAVLRTLNVEYYLAIASFGREYNETRGDIFVSWDWDISEQLRLTLGGNLGYQDGDSTTGVDTQPDIRLAYQPRDDTTIWSAISANKEPDSKFRDSGLLVRRQASNLTAFEVGLRRRFGESFLIQADAYYYLVRDQENGQVTEPNSGATLFLTDGKTDAFGGEIHASWKPTPQTKLTAFAAQTEADSSNIDASQYFLIEDEVPRFRGGLTAGFEPFPRLELDATLLYTQQWSNIPSWWRLDLRVAWRATDNTSIELVGQNLTDPQHQEYFYDEQIQRGGYVMVTHQF